MPAYGPGGRTLIKGATVTNSSPPTSCHQATLAKRYGRSCDLTERHGDDDNVAFDNPIAQVYRFKNVLKELILYNADLQQFPIEYGDRSAVE
ncbi:hypothetical protein AB6A40_007199 [Gnathostoma spinigerum]|uniref:Uncharacterized protein n=1 Tax=Gnathostoma spinigerum TaxID=75299 RepID=A0ABD6EW61_9BILA